MPEPGVVVPFFEPETVGWLSSESSGIVEDVWTKVKVLSQNGPLVTVRLLGKKNGVLHIDLRTDHLEAANDSVESDLTALHHMNEAAILQNLQERSYSDHPYTFMGNVLVAVNPLKYSKEPPNALGKRHAGELVHPYAVAEVAYQQMSFRGNQMRREQEDLVDQSIVTSGESGAGKTENAKMLMRHLVYRAGEESSELAARMLESNTILEAFGNAGTLRNHNSSRFGKLMKLWFEQGESKVGELPVFSIVRASITTYLLEQSRITLHGFGEHNFHIFYYLLNGEDDLKNQLNLSNQLLKKEKGKYGFRYLDPVNLDDLQTGQRKRRGKKSSAPTVQSVSAEIARSKDASNYLTLMMSFEDYNISGDKLSNVLKILGGILHVGNVMFKEKEGTHTDQAEEDTSTYEASYSPLHVAAELLEVNVDALTALLTSRKLKVRGESSIVTLSAKGAAIARDSLSRLIYVGLFDWIVRTINIELGHGNDDDSHHFIGILDIFGFEVFQLNTFEQLLINYANEALQGTFERSVFQYEMELYKKEGLLHDSDESPMEVPDNSICLELFEGPTKGGGGKAKRNMEIGLLRLIDAESQSIKPSDEKLNASLHRVYDRHQCFPRIHPNDRREKFIVQHYAGAVTYTVGSFVKKNRNGFLKPEDMIELLGQSSNPVLSEIMETTGAQFKEAESKHIRPKTVVGKFTQQIHQLIDTLESTSTSFVRCIKPNPSLTRSKHSKTWFNRRYVSAQLATLSIPQTVKVLSTGYPTRIPFKTLLEQYKSLLPKDAVEMWEKSKTPDTKGFIEALFYAFEVERTKFKMGYTKVFFKSGQIADLEKVFSASQSWKTDKAAQEAFVKRFKGYYIRKKWRVAYAKVIAMNRFKHMAIAVHERREAERLERERKERERKAKLRRQWRVAIIFVRTQVRLLHLLEQVKEKRRLAEEARQAELAKKSAEERAAAEEEEKKRVAAEEAKREEAKKEDLKKAESVRTIMNQKLNEENEEIARIEEKEKETLAKIEEQRSLQAKKEEETPDEEKKEEVEEEEEAPREGTSILAELKRYDPLGRLGAQWEVNKKRVVDAFGANKREQVLKEEAISHVEAIQAEREKEQRRLEKQAQENLRALNIDIDFDDEDFKRARARDAEDAKKLIALEEERLKFESLLEEHKEEKQKNEEEGATEEKKEEEGQVESSVSVFKKYNWDIFDWEKHEVTQEDIDDGSGVTEEMLGKTYYYNTKTGARQWEAPQINIIADKDDEEEDAQANKDLVRKAHEQAVAEADKLDLTPKEREEMISNLEQKYLHNLATNKVAMGLMQNEHAVSRFYHRFKGTHFFKHAERSAEEKLKEAEAKHATTETKKKKRRSILSRLHLHGFHHGEAKKKHEHVVDPTNKKVKKVVKLTEEQAKNPALAARQHAEALDGLVEKGKITPLEHVQLKSALVEAASKDGVREKRTLSETAAASVQIHCPNCDVVINTANGSVCPNCSYELKSELVNAPKLVDRTESDEALDKAHYDEKKWDLSINSRKGKLRVRLGHSKTEYEEMSARDLTFFEVEVLLEKVEVKNKKAQTKESSFRQWLVIHSFTEFLELSQEINSGKLGKDNLKKNVRNAIKPIPSPSGNTFIEEDFELIVNANPEKYKGQIEDWMRRLSHALNKKDKKFGRPLFSTTEIDTFFELSDHSPEEFDATFSY